MDSDGSDDNDMFKLNDIFETKKSTFSLTFVFSIYLYLFLFVNFSFGKDNV